MLQKRTTETVESWRHSPGSAERLLGLWAVSAGLTMTTPEYAAGPRTVTWHVLHVVLAGSLELRTDRGEPTSLAAGDLFCLFPRVTYRYGPLPRHQPPRMMWLSIDGPAAAPLVADLGLTPHTPFARGLRTKPFLTHVPALRAAMDEGPDHRGLLRVEYLARFIGEIIGQTTEHRHETSKAALVRHGKDLIDAHFDSHLTIGEIADRLKVDRSHFGRAFLKIVGESPSSYLRRRRLMEGRRMLRETDLSVTEAALSVGYSDVVAFSHSYRRFFGVSPTADRDSTDSTTPG